MNRVATAEPVAGGQELALLGLSGKAREVFLSSVVRVGPFLLGIAGQVILTRLLRPEDFGAFAFAGALLALPSALLAWPLHMALVQLPDAEELETTVFTLSLLLGVLLLASAVAIALAVRRTYGETVAALVVGFGLIETLGFFSYFYEGLLKKSLAFLRLAVMRATASTVSTLLAVALGLMGFGVWSLLSKDLLFMAACLVGYALAVRYHGAARFRLATAKKVLAFSARLVLIRGLEKLLVSIERLLLGFLGLLPGLGVYTRAQYLTTTAVSGLGPVTVETAFPVYARLQTDATSLARAFYGMSYVVVRLAMLPATLGIAFAGWLVPFLYGSRWDAAVPLLQWLSVLILLGPVAENGKSFLYGMGRPTAVVWVKLVQLGLGAPLLVLAILRWDIQGAALAAVAMAGIETLGVHWEIRKLIPVPFLRLFLPPFVAATAAALVVTGPGKLAGVAGVAATMVLYVVFLLILERRELWENVRCLVRVR